ncbi:MAG: sigma-54-dependent Fis family transcriptional regulator, partial [Candidatus Tectomicrobia bacterium]|nr:sigma-54-dependent Fis family transcriptional regulator [Candidatus Tectomicrobia bacterium]
ARIIAATNRDLQARIKEGAFREDLYYRLNVITIKIPPLRERQEDIPLLAYHFLKKFVESTGKEVQEISPEAMRILLQYDWPGNVRELENVLERALILAEHKSILPSDLPEHLNRIANEVTHLSGDDEEKIVSLEEIERSYILKILGKTRGNKHLAAQLLGIDRSTLYRKLDQYSIPKTFKTNAD